MVATPGGISPHTYTITVASATAVRAPSLHLESSFLPVFLSLESPRISIIKQIVEGEGFFKI